MDIGIFFFRDRIVKGNKIREVKYLIVEVEFMLLGYKVIIVMNMLLGFLFKDFDLYNLKM